MLTITECKQIIKNIRHLLDAKDFRNDSNPWLALLKESCNAFEKGPDKKIDKKIERFENDITRLIRFNQTDIIHSLLSNNSQFIKLLEKISVFSSLNHGINSEEKPFIIHAICRNAIETLDILLKKMEEKPTFEHLKIAFKANATSSAAFLLKKVTLTKEERDQLADIAKSSANISMLQLLLPESDDELTTFYFNDFLQKIEKEEKIEKDTVFNAISKAYRFSEMSKVNLLYKNFFNHLERYKEKFPLVIEQIVKEIEQAKELAPQWLSQIARYMSPWDSYQLKKTYKADILDITSEIKFGLTKFNYIKNLCDDEKFRAMEIKLLPELEGGEFLQDTKYDIKNFMSMGTLLRLLAHQCSKEAENKDYDSAEKHGEFNCWFLYNGKWSRGTYTPFHAGRYDSMTPFIVATINIEKRKKFIKQLNSNNGYELIYKGFLLTKVCFISDNLCPSSKSSSSHWRHGIRTEVLASEIWPDIEKLHQLLINMRKDDIEKNPKIFYDRVATILWLLGNLTPLKRGTGRIVEQYLGFIHYYHKLPIPVSEREFQLDCRNITFPLEEYKKIFLHFFEPASLSPSALKYRERNAIDPSISHYVNIFRAIQDSEKTMQMDKKEEKNKKEERREKTPSFFSHLFATKNNTKDIKITEPIEDKYITPEFDLLDFIERHKKKYKSHFFNRTGITDYSQLNTKIVFEHAQQKTFFGKDNRTAEILKEMKVSLNLIKPVGINKMVA